MEFDAELFSHEKSFSDSTNNLKFQYLKRQSVLSIWGSALHEKLTWTLEPKADDFLSDGCQYWTVSKVVSQVCLNTSMI